MVHAVVFSPLSGMSLTRNHVSLRTNSTFKRSAQSTRSSSRVPARCQQPPPQAERVACSSTFGATSHHRLAAAFWGLLASDVFTSGAKAAEVAEESSNLGAIGGVVLVAAVGGFAAYSSAQKKETIQKNMTVRGRAKPRLRSDGRPTTLDDL
ncbi:hypothetical protein CYMTET_22433 [Cymbomonas tetramitiformis]|uniref:Uncharacterized protein n=1 Tax=Cymbomonas tetramitiformis TaxID=36881 RepID=A0AAE0L252_9CHLO|nr:hypothetical protein CYMTET_22433 [Cymbomonas tetramitiformis]